MWEAIKNLSLTRKIVIAVISIVALLLIIVIVSFVNKPQQQITTTAPPVPPDGNREPISLTETSILFPGLVKENIFYQGLKSGNLNYLSLADNKITILVRGDDLLPIKQIMWSPEGERALIYNYQEKGTLVWQILNIANRQMIPLENNIQIALFLSNNQIVYQVKNEKENYLALANENGEGRGKLIDIDLFPIKLFAVDKNKIGFSGSPTSQIKIVDITTKTIKVLNLPGPTKAKNLVANRAGQIGVVQKNKFLLFNAGTNQMIRTVNLPPLTDLSEKGNNFMLDEKGKNLYFTLNDFLYKLEL